MTAETLEGDIVQTDRRAVLEALAAEGGPLGQMATDLLMARDEREAQAAEDARLREATANATLADDAEVKAALRVQVRDQQAIVDASILSDTAKLLRSQGWDEDYVRTQVEQIRADQSKLAEWSKGSDAIHDSTHFREEEFAARGRERAVAEAKAMAEPYGFEGAAAEAEAAMQSQLLQWASGSPYGTGDDDDA